MEGMDAAGDGDDDADRRWKPSSQPDGRPESKQWSGNSTMTSTAAHRQKLALDEALEFLTALKKNLDLGTYKQFLRTMVDFSSKRDRAKCVERVKELLKKHPDLSLRFENFVPTEGVVAIVSGTGRHPDYDDAVSLVLNIKERLPEDGYKTFLKILGMYRFNWISRGEVYDKFVGLFKDHDDLLGQLGCFIKEPDDHVSANLDDAEGSPAKRHKLASSERINVKRETLD